jgi:single-stranded-DNA-specific exonuclease
MKYRWVPYPGNAETANRLSAQAGISPLLARCLANRSIQTAAEASEFLNPRLRDLADPFLLPQMSEAVERLLSARAAMERVVVFGDYDVDGVTATCLLVQLFRKLGWSCEYCLPHRLEEGYGLSPEAMERCLSQFQPRLLLAVDCGSSSHALIGKLQSEGVDVIVLDHHQLSEPPPKPLALVNPHAANGGGADVTEYCSAGLAFKLAHAILKRARLDPAWPEAQTFDIRQFLDLAALGTIADMAPLRGENRTLTRAGLQRISESSRPGIAALKKVCGAPPVVEESHVSFYMAPRLNAAGRLESALDALHLLLSEDQNEADRLARQLNQQNIDRQQLEQTIFDQARAAVSQRFNAEKDCVIVAGDEAWHVGVVGIVASRILRQFHRPTVIFGGDGGPHWRGSARSIEGIDVAAAFRECSEMLFKHGGHAMAAGASIQPALLDCFREKLNAIVERQRQPGLFLPRLSLDGETSLAELRPEVFLELEQLQPFGQGNPPPHFFVRQVRLAGSIQRFGAENKHARFSAEDGAARLPVIWWNFPADFDPGQPFDLAFTPETNRYRSDVIHRLKAIDFNQNHRVDI